MRSILLLLCLASAGCFTGNYLVQQAGGQFRLLAGRERIRDVLADPGTPPELRRRLALAWEAREFGIHRLGLRGGDAFTRFYNTHEKPVAWNLSAAQKDQLRLVTYSFPIVGRVPYLGFFDEKDARREQQKLAALGFDTYLRPVAGYSTLGLTSDPVFSSMIDGDDVRIVEVVLHEMTHTTVYITGRSDWNESVASFIGNQGAALFFAEREGADAAQKILIDAAKREKEDERFGQFLAPVLAELGELFKERIPREEKLRRREEIFKRAQAKFLEWFPPPPGRRPGSFATRPLNNAILMAFGVYHSSRPEHERLFLRLGRDLPDFVDEIKKAAENHSDPIGYLRRLATR